MTPPPDPFNLEQFQDYLAVEAAHSRHTVESYLRDVRRLVDYAAGKGVGDPSAITAERLRDFIYFLKDLGLATSSIARHVSSVRTYFRFLVSESRVAQDPSERLESPKQWRKLPAVLTVIEAERLLAAPDADQPLGWRDRALLEFAYATGARVSELVGVTVQDVWFDDGLVRIYGKGAKERLVPLGRRAAGAVAVY
ncbi:MAG: site-specific integrase, partial [Gemmatimonadales bacterium]